MNSISSSLRHRFTTSVFVIVVILLASFTFCDPASAQISAHDQDIARMDAAIDRVLIRQRANRQARGLIDDFASAASAWFQSIDHNGKEIADIQRQIRERNYSTMNDSQLHSALQNLQNERAAIVSPPGGRMVEGRRYESLQQLQNAMSPKANELIALNKEYDTLSRELRTLDAERDRLVDAQRAHNALDKKLLNELKTRYNETAKDMNDKEKWCERSYVFLENKAIPGPAICTDRRLMLLAIVDAYKKKLKKTGGPVDRQALASLIKGAQEISNEVKQAMRQEILPGLKGKITRLQALQKKQNRPMVELAGCWLLLQPGGGGQPAVLNITRNQAGDYLATISNSGWIGLPGGHILFSVARINENTFDGTEYSIINKRGTQTALRVVVGRTRKSASYRTRDDMVTLVPCQ